MCVVVAHGEVLTVETEEEICEYEDHQKGDAEQNEDEDKVRFLRGDLFNFHIRIGCAGANGRWRRMGRLVIVSSEEDALADDRRGWNGVGMIAGKFGMGLGAGVAAGMVGDRRCR